MNSIKRFDFFPFPVLLGFLVMLGCDGNNQVPTYVTTGVVHFEGKPMKGGGAISFVPVGKQTGMPAGGSIAEDGTFVMSTYGEGDGSVPGKFRVTIMQTTAAEPTMTQNEDGSEPTMATEPTVTVRPEDTIPLTYADPLNTPLEVEVMAQENNELTIELKRQ
ncbi:hypothetical protein [Rosistilla oblonga]|uniref:hypothetical protein n=1 Tax=Rosistilla oblonga TaxID=2527990 RepID=UPI003A97B27F